MGQATAITPDEPTPPTKSFLARLIGVYISPRPTFTDISRRPGFVAPLIVGVVATVAVTETMIAKIGMERIVRNSIEQSGRASSMSPDQMQQAVEQGARIGGIIAHLSGFLIMPIYLLIVAGVGLLIVNAIFGARVHFKKAFSVVCYANLISVLGGLIALALILFGDPEHFNPQTPSPTNLGFFLNPLETSKPLMALATSLDLFILWFLVLLGIGFSEATEGTVKSRSVFLVYLGLWMIWVLGKMGIALLT